MASITKSLSRTIPFCTLFFAIQTAPLMAQTDVATTDVVDGVAAVVNQDIITFSQVRELIGSRERALQSTASGQELADKVRELRQGAINDLVDRQLILQEFKKNKFQIPNHYIEERIQQIIREDFGGDRQAFVRTLQAQNFTLARFRELERDKIIVQAMRSHKLQENLIISPSKLHEAYNSAKSEFTTPEQVKLRMILINKDGEATNPDQADPKKTLADEVRTKLAKGAQFDEMAQKYSEDSSRENGGDWGWVDRKTLNEKLSQVAFSLKPKQISPVIPYEDAYYILTVDEKKAAYTKPMHEVRNDLEKKLSTDQKEEIQKQWIEDLRKKAYIKVY